MAKEPLLSIKSLSKKFGSREAVKGVDLEIRKGECLALLGPNGAGKTTIIKMILGVVIPSSGDIFVFNKKHSTELAQIKQRIGVVPQNDNLDPDLSVLENLLIYGGYYRIGRREAKKRATELLHFFALGRRKNEKIQNLSGGQRRRLLISRALINKPALLILDEPTIGLDPQARHLIWEKLHALQAAGTTMLLTSHYMEEVTELATRVIIIDQGRVVAKGEPFEMVKNMVGDEVIEIEGTPSELASFMEEAAGCNATFEQRNSKLYIYARKPCDDLEALALDYHRMTKRPASLEDLFLKLTGRRLKEN